MKDGGFDFCFDQFIVKISKQFSFDLSGGQVTHNKRADMINCIHEQPEPDVNQHCGDEIGADHNRN